jgi:hypothetical protein
MRVSSVPAATPGTSIVTVPPGPATASPDVAPALANPPARLHVPWSNRTGAPRGASART